RPALSRLTLSSDGQHVTAGDPCSKGNTAGDSLHGCRSTPIAADGSFDPRGLVAVARPWGWTLELFDTPRAIPPYEQQISTCRRSVRTFRVTHQAVVGRQRSKS